MLTPILLITPRACARYAPRSADIATRDSVAAITHANAIIDAYADACLAALLMPMPAMPADAIAITFAAVAAVCLIRRYSPAA